MNKNPSVHSLFNSISDLFNTQEINGAIKRLHSIPNRLHLIDKILKRREEIKVSDEMSQITKLAPVFNRLKQKFLQKLRMSRMKTQTSQSPLLMTSLYQKPALEPEMPHLERSKRTTVVKMIASFNDHGQRKSNIPIGSYENLDFLMKRRSNASSVTFGLLSPPLSPEIKRNFNTECIMEIIPKKKAKFCKFSSVINANHKYTKTLEKDLIQFAKSNEESSNILETENSCKTMKLIDSKIKQKLANFLKQKPFPKKSPDITYIKNKRDSLKSFKVANNTNNTTKNVRRSSIFFQTKKEKNMDDESYVSFTEMRLMKLYKESKKMKEEISENDRSFRNDRFNREFQREKLRTDIKKNFNEIMRVVKRKIA